MYTDKSFMCVLLRLTYLIIVIKYYGSSKYWKLFKKHLQSNPKCPLESDSIRFVSDKR